MTVNRASHTGSSVSSSPFYIEDRFNKYDMYSYFYLLYYIYSIYYIYTVIIRMYSYHRYVCICMYVCMQVHSYYHTNSNILRVFRVLLRNVRVIYLFVRNSCRAVAVAIVGTTYVNTSQAPFFDDHLTAFLTNVVAPLKNAKCVYFWRHATHSQSSSKTKC